MELLSFTDLFGFHAKNTRSVESSPSFSTVGMREKKVLKDMDAIKPVPSGDGLAILTDDQYAALQASKLTESEVIKYFTPVLQPLVKEAAGKTGYNLILVNSERHPWVEGPHGGEASKPDMIVLDAALVATSVSDADKPLAEDGFYFGVPADFDLCDSISVIMEWKVDMGKDAHAAFGEGLEYARRMHSPSRIGGTSCEEDRQRQHVMLADKKGFVLSVVKHNRAISYTHGQWNTPGSRNAIVDFFACRRKWLDAIRDSCRKLAVSPVVPAPVKLSLEKVADATNENKSAFLGRGATGRVFLVRGTSDGGPQLALKVSLGRDGCSRLLSESQIAEDPPSIDGLKKVNKAEQVSGLTVCLLDGDAPISDYLEREAPVSLRPSEKRTLFGVYIYAPLTGKARVCTRGFRAYAQSLTPFFPLFYLAQPPQKKPWPMQSASRRLRMLLWLMLRLPCKRPSRPRLMRRLPCRRPSRPRLMQRLPCRWPRRRRTLQLLRTRTCDKRSSARGRQSWTKPMPDVEQL